MAQALLPAGSTLVSTLLPGCPQNAEMSLGAADTSVRATSAAATLFLRVSLMRPGDGLSTPPSGPRTLLQRACQKDSRQLDWRRGELQIFAKWGSMGQRVYRA